MRRELFQLSPPNPMSKAKRGRKPKGRKKPTPEQEFKYEMRFVLFMFLIIFPIVSAFPHEIHTLMLLPIILLWNMWGSFWNGGVGSLWQVMADTWNFGVHAVFQTLPHNWAPPPVPPDKPVYLVPPYIPPKTQPPSESQKLEQLIKKVNELQNQLAGQVLYNPPAEKGNPIPWFINGWMLCIVIPIILFLPDVIVRCFGTDPFGQLIEKWLGEEEEKKEEKTKEELAAERLAEEKVKKELAARKFAENPPSMVRGNDRVFWSELRKKLEERRTDPDWEHVEDE